MVAREGSIPQHPDTAAAVFECCLVSFRGALRERKVAQLAICVVAEATLRTPRPGHAYSPLTLFCQRTRCERDSSCASYSSGVLRIRPAFCAA